MTRREGAIARFLATETSGGAVLLAATVVALVWANISSTYGSFWHSPVTIGPVGTDLVHIVNEGLMTLFFFVVGLEIKREFVDGELRSARVAITPVIAAIGGMAVPAAIYLAFNPAGAEARGWAIPMATDIAFVLGILALLGRRVPSGLRVFLLALAIIDDIGAIVIIAAVYSTDVKPWWLAVAAVSLGAVALLRVARVPYPLVYVAPALGAWIAMASAGIHPTIAGVAVGLMTPLRDGRGRDVLQDLLDRFHPLSSFLIVPLFALANAGVSLRTAAGVWTSPVLLGVAAGLLVGKVIGIAGGASLARALRIGRLPAGVGTFRLLGGSALGGIGFTVSLFVTGLAFDAEPLASQAKLGVLVGSVVSALVGGALLASRRWTEDPSAA